MARKVTPASQQPDGDNGGCPPEVYYDWHRKLTLSAAALREAASVHQNNFKKAKSDGVDIDAEKIVLKRGRRDSEENFAQDDKVAEYERILGRRRQTALFDQPGDHVDENLATRIRDDDAEQEGYDAGLAKRTATDSRFAAGTSEAAAFARGHAKAVDFLKRSGDIDNQTTTAGPRKRGAAAAKNDDPKVH